MIELLPTTNVLSELLIEALDDLEAISKNPKYKIDMDVWHIGLNNKCYVCMAGAMLANRNIISSNEIIIHLNDLTARIADFNQRERVFSILAAVDKLRKFNAVGAAVALNMEITQDFDALDDCLYEKYTEKAKEQRIESICPTPRTLPTYLALRRAFAKELAEHGY